MQDKEYAATVHQQARPEGAQRIPLAQWLYALAVSRDETAWTHLLENYGAELLSVTRAVLWDHALAEDGAQQALLLIREHASKFRVATGQDADEQARKWILRVACTAALQIQRSRRRAEQREEEYALERARRAADSILGVTGSRQSDAELMAVVLQELDALSEEHRLPVLMRYRCEFEYLEIARYFGCPVSTARTRVHRGLERLRERLAALGLLFSAVELERIGIPRILAREALDSRRLAHWKTLIAQPKPPAVRYSLPAQGGISAMAKISLGLLGACAAVLFTVSRTHSEEALRAVPEATVNAAQPPAETQRPSLDERRRIAQENYEKARRAGELAEATRLNGADVKEGEVLTRTTPNGDIYRITRTRGEVSVRKTFDAAAEREKEQIAKNPLLAKVTFTFVDQSAGEVLKFLALLSKIPIEDKMNEAQRQTPITLSVSNLPLGDALHWIAELSGAGFSQDATGVAIGGSPSTPQPAEFEDLPKIDALDRKLTLKFQETLLASATEFVHELTGTTLVVEGPLQAKKVSLSVKDVSARDVVNQLAVACGAEAHWRFGAVFIHRPLHATVSKKNDF